MKDHAHRMSVLQVGAEIDGWRLDRKIGQGSMGTVYEARRAGVRAAVKVIRADATDEENLARFRREARVLMDLEHPAVVRCLGTGELDAGESGRGGVYVALEFLDGGSLQDVLDRRGRLPLPQAIGAIRAIFSGLAVIHAQGIVHRDVKPANVLLAADGRAKLADFGLARPTDGSTALTQTGTILGTPYYMAPELIRGEEVGPSIDIYAAGATLWTLLTGEPPYPGDNPLKVLQAHLRLPVPDLRQKLPNAPEKLVRALDALLAKHPDDRPHGAAEALAALEGLPAMVIGPDPRASGERPAIASAPAAVEDPRPAQRKTGARSTVAMEALGEAERAPSPRSATRPVSRTSPALDATRAAPALDGPREQRRTTDRRRRSASSAESTTATGPAAAPVDDDLPDVVPPRPLPAPRRSRWWGRLVALAALLATLHVTDMLLRARGTDGLRLASERLVAWEDATRATPPAAGSVEATLAQAAPWLHATLRGLGRGRDWVDGRLLQLLGVVGLLVLERLFARACRYGLVERFVQGRRARLLIRAGEVHRAALVYEDLGRRAQAGHLLLAHGMPAVAADMFLAAGMVAEARAARALAPQPARKSAARGATSAGRGQALDASSGRRPTLPPGSDPRALARAHLEAGRAGEAIDVYLAANLRYDAAELLEREGRLDEAIAALEAAWSASSDGRDYWHYLGKKGLLEEARPRLADRTAALCLAAGRRAEAATWYERAGASEEARALFEEAGDHRAVARCLLQGVPPEGPLKPGQRDRVEQAARALARVGDPSATTLFLRADCVQDAAQSAAAVGDAATAVELYATAGLPGLAAECAERAGDRARAAELWDEAEDYVRASALYEEVGDLDAAAHAAGRAGDHARQAALFERSDQPVEAAEVWARIGQGDEALRVLGGVEPGAHRWDEARAVAGDVYHQAGRHAEAVEAYKVGLPDVVHFQEQVGAQLNYAASLEAVGDFDLALSVLSRLDGKEFAPMDLNQRKGRVDQKRGGPGGSGGSGGSGGPQLPRSPSVRVTTPNELIGTQIASYEVLRYVGEGSFAWVFEARHTTLAREAALKVLKPALSSGEAPRRFLREGRAVAGLKHPHLIEIYDAGDVDGLYYLALEFVKGPTLKKLISDEAPFPSMRAARIGAGILSGVGAAHRKGIVHRDLKPANVLVGKGMQAKVLDFGLARVFDDAGQSATAGYLGTPRYASPEQARGSEVGEAADQYAAGLVIYEMLTGKLPFESKTSLGFLALHAHEAPRPIRDLKADVPAPIADAVMRSLEKDPKDRHESVGAFERILATFLGAGKRPPPPSRA
jgi:serine/threonine-protein kinase